MLSCSSVWYCQKKLHTILQGVKFSIYTEPEHARKAVSREAAIAKTDDNQYYAAGECF
jgi:hypothetical protein